MLRDGASIGAIAVTRRIPGRSPTIRSNLLRTFADQAVIAIENVRLFSETKEALEQQKASAEILGVNLRSSTADMKPVFEEILESCEQLFEGQLVGITQVEEGVVRLLAYHGPEAGSRKIYPLPLSRESGPAGRSSNAEVAHFPDTEAAGVPPGTVTGCRDARRALDRFRTDAFARGAASARSGLPRHEPGGFRDKQIAQLRTFADQAVIAIQNVRLFNEMKEALEQQNASADVLTALGEVGRRSARRSISRRCSKTIVRSAASRRARRRHQSTNTTRPGEYSAYRRPTTEPSWRRTTPRADSQGRSGSACGDRSRRSGRTTRTVMRPDVSGIRAPRRAAIGRIVSDGPAAAGRHSASGRFTSAASRPVHSRRKIVELLKTFATNRRWRSRTRACSARSPRRASSSRRRASTSRSSSRA